jgi:hypothetical protein
LSTKKQDWIADRFRALSLRQYFSFSPVVFTSSKRFAPQNVALASLPCASGLFSLNFGFVTGCSSSFQEQKRFC